MPSTPPTSPAETPGLLALADLRGPGAALVAATEAMGFSAEVARSGLTAEFGAWSPSALAALRHEAAGLERARLPRRVLIIAPRTLPASTLRQCLLARIIGAEVVLKTASGQERLADAIAQSDPGVTARPFGSDDTETLKAAIAEVDSVVVLGSDETVGSVRSLVPASMGFVGYGHKVSAAWLGASPDDADLWGLAEDLCAWDQAGCLSPQVAWVGPVADMAEVVDRLAAKLRRVELGLPMAVADDTLMARYPMQTLGEMTGTTAVTETALVVGLESSAFRFAPAARSLWVLRASDDALVTLGSTLSTLGLAKGVAALPVAPDVRCCPLGQMQRPSMAWRHDGRPNLASMLLPDL